MSYRSNDANGGQRDGLQHIWASSKFLLREEGFVVMIHEDNLNSLYGLEVDCLSIYIECGVTKEANIQPT